MKVVIVGYGHMGRLVERICQERNHQVICRVDAGGYGDEKELSLDILKEAQGVIEFALPQGIEKNLELYLQSEVPTVVGTTGWNDLYSKWEKRFKEKGSLIYGSNFSIGANLFFAMAAKAATLIEDRLEYDIMVTEYHHKRKKDSPSGTAITTAEKIMENLSRKTKPNYDRINRAIEDDELHVASVRGGYIPGTHKVLLDSLADSIEITHTARSREGFALGSVVAMEWMQNKRGFISVDEFMKDIIS